jgi:cytochrome c1
MRKFVITALAAVGLAAGSAMASEGAHLTTQSWSWDGVFGSYDQKQLQRGFTIFHDVCSNCHSLKLVSYRNLKDIGLTAEKIKEVAAEKQVTDGPNDQGEMFQRPALPSDKIVAPFPNDQAARVSNNGALPPDLSLMTKARKGGPDYVYSLMTGYHDAPADFKLNDGMSYNTVFAGNQIGMPQPLMDDIVTYADGTKATLDQEAKDIVAFLNWAAEPELNERHRLGLATMIFLLVLTGLMYALKREIWKDVH